MFGENLKAMRKAKGYTQQELAMKLNVVRQTVSKWEKGLSVPDQLAIKNRKSKRIWKAVGIILLVIIIFNILLMIFGSIASKGVSTNVETSVVEQQNGAITGFVLYE